MNNVVNILQKLGIHCTDARNEHGQPLELLFIKNPDDSIRWIWPSGAFKPFFLKFYNIQGWKASLFAVWVKFVFILKIQKVCFRSVKVFVRNSEDQQILRLSDTRWALFTGTTGPNQKYVLYRESTNHEDTFTKIPLHPRGQTLLDNEEKIVRKLEQAKQNVFEFPMILSGRDRALSISGNSQYDQRIRHLSPAHGMVLNFLRTLDQQLVSYSYFDQLHQISNRIRHLKDHRRQIPSGIIKKLEKLNYALNGTELEINLAHGDFTPWNMLADQAGRLFVYDWELAHESYPKGFDFFHFIFQQNILIQKATWTTIKNEIKTYAPVFWNQGEEKKYLPLYLITNVLNYLEIYDEQTAWHPQVNWLLDTWNIALSDVLADTIHERELLILDIFDHLHDKQYAGLKLAEIPEKTSVYSDIDMLMPVEVCHSLKTFLQKHCLVQKQRVHSGFAMTRYILQTNDGSLLSLDAIHQLKRKSLEYMIVSEVIKRPYVNKDGIKYVGLMDTLQFIGLFYGLNGKTPPDKFKKYNHVLRLENKKLEQLLTEQSQHNEPKQAELQGLLLKNQENRGFSSFLHKITYVLDAVIRIFLQKGMVITFSGVDGAGKSTVIEKTKHEIEKKLRKNVVVIRHRPSVLPILSAWTKGKKEAEAASMSKLPRQGKNKNFMSSLLRFAYYYSDYLFGQFYIYVRYVLRGDIVLYDRYYFDFIIDSLRSNIRLPKWLLKSGYTFLFKPSVNFFLYADPEVILRRKKELEASTIRQLTNQYINLFAELGSRHKQQYLAVENVDLDVTLQYITRSIQQKYI